MAPNWIALIVLFCCCVSLSMAEDGGWSAWDKWSPCSVTCGKGIQSRFRLCNNPRPSAGGKWCEGSLKEIGPCSANEECSVNGGWTEWTDWSPCSVTCGEGHKTRDRSCSNPKPAFGGKNCEGPEDQREPCVNQKQCPRDGGWSDWSEWSPCSVTCGKGLQQMQRDCNNPPPSAGGKPCSGDAKVSKECAADVECPVNGQWSNWGEWTPCSSTCGQGQKQRIRSCNDPPPKHGGLPCDGEEMDQVQSIPCGDITKKCPIDGEWSDWSEHGPCEASNCYDADAVAYTIRHRSCINPLPQNGGTMCKGSFIDANICLDPTNCRRDGGWGEWSEWMCSDDLAKRVRTCDNPTPSNGGLPCPPNEGVEFYSIKANPMSFKSICDPNWNGEVLPLYGDEMANSTEDYYISED